jgi:hypothetical protein
LPGTCEAFASAAEPTGGVRIPLFITHKFFNTHKEPRPMEIYCRHCDKKTSVKVSSNGPHLQAVCLACNNWLKFLNQNEKTTLLKELLAERETDRTSKKTAD